MAKYTHTWKIGEYCKGGIITVQITGKIIHVIGKDWDHSKGDRRSSDQSQAKEWTRETVESTDPQVRRKLYEFLTNLTTIYYADTIIEWIESKVELYKSLFW